MSNDTQKILQEALLLPPDQRTILIDQLVASLTQIDSPLDQLWTEEAQRRLDAYHAGQKQSFPAEQVFEELSAL